MGKDRKNYRKVTSESEKAKSLLDDMHTKYDDDDLLEEILMETLDSDKGRKHSHISDVDLSDILGENFRGGSRPAAKQPEKALAPVKSVAAKPDKTTEQKPAPIKAEKAPEKKPEKAPAPVKSVAEKPDKPAEQKPAAAKPETVPVKRPEKAPVPTKAVTAKPERPAEQKPVAAKPDKTPEKKPEVAKPEPEKPAVVENSGLEAKVMDIAVKNHEVSIKEQKPVEQKPVEQKPVVQKSAEHKHSDKKISPSNLAEFVEYSEEDRQVNAEISAAVTAAIAEKAEKNRNAVSADEPVKKKKAKKKAPEIKPVKPILNIANIVYTAVAFAAVTAAFLALPREAVSETEQRKLAEFPTFSAEEFLNGKYTNGITDYFNDNVPYRDDLKKVAAQIRNLYGISYNDAEIIGPVAVVTTEDEPEPDIEEEEPEQTTTTTAAVTEKTTGRTTAPVTTTEKTTTTPETTTQPVETTKNVNEIAAGVVTNGQVVTKLSDGHWWGISLYGGGNGKTYAKALNRFKKELGDDVNIWSMPAPTSGEFYLPDSYSQYNASHAGSIEQINAQLKGVTPVDCISELWKHVGENIYLRTDHHWQPLGAYYAAKSFVEAAGLPFADISTMERVDIDGYMGTMYGFTESANLLSDPETFTYYKPTNKYYAYYYDTAYNYTGQFAFFIPMPVNGSYSTFMGADNKIVRIATDAGTGRKLVVFKDSYGNAEIPFYFNSFDEVYVCDMRYFDLNAVEFVKFTGATDVLFTCCTFSAVGANAKGLETILNNPVTTITEGAKR